MTKACDHGLSWQARAVQEKQQANGDLGQPAKAHCRCAAHWEKARQYHRGQDGHDVGIEP
jgi:hypothetical protein